MQMHHFFNRIFSLHIPGIYPVFKYRGEKLLGGRHKAIGQTIHKRSFDINMHTKGFLWKNILNNCLDP